MWIGIQALIRVMGLSSSRNWNIQYCLNYSFIKPIAERCSQQSEYEIIWSRFEEKSITDYVSYENKWLASIVYEWFSLEPCVTWVVCTVFSVEEFEGSRKRVDARVDEGQLDIWRRWFRWMKIAEWKRESFEEEDFDSWYTLMFTSHEISRN